MINRYYAAAHKFGLIGGVLCGIAFWIMYLIGVEPIGMTLVFGYLITPIFVYLGIKNFKDNYNNKQILFSHGMTVGFFIYTILALISALIIFVSLSFLPEVLINFRTINTGMLDGRSDEIISQLSRESFDQARSSIVNMSAYDVALNDFLRKIIPGLFYTIIISVILKITSR